MRSIILVSGFFLVAAMALPAFGEDWGDDGWGDEPAEESGGAASGEEGSSEETSEDDAFLSGEEKPEIEAPAEDKSADLAEDPDEKIFAVGVRLRWIMIPEWFIKMFGVSTRQASKYERGLPLISNVGVGPEFVYRKGGFDITAAIWYAGLGWNPISMKGDNESPNSWEVVENDMRAILFTADFIWSTPITDWVAITYGAGLGFGVRWGDVVETEAMAEGPNGEEYLVKCDQWDANVAGCNDIDEQTGEPTGEFGKTYDKFKAFPWVEFLVGARFKPHRNVSIYVDGGFSLGFQLGLRAHYIF